jgi:hypothetical protein
MATGASTPSSRRTSSPVQRCEAGERNQTGANDPPAEELASTSKTVGHPSFGSACRACRQIANRLPPLCATSQRLAAQVSTNAACIWIAGSRRSSRPSTLGVCPRSAEVGPDACRAASERRASARRSRRSTSHSAGVAATAFCSAGSAANKIAGERLRAKRKTAMIT